MEMHVLHTSGSVLLCRLEGSHFDAVSTVRLTSNGCHRASPALWSVRLVVCPCALLPGKAAYSHANWLWKWKMGEGTCCTPFCKRSESKHQRSLMLSRLRTKLASELVVLFRFQAGAERKCFFCFSCLRGDLKLISMIKAHGLALHYILSTVT